MRLFDEIKPVKKLNDVSTEEPPKSKKARRLLKVRKNEKQD